MSDERRRKAAHLYRVLDSHLAAAAIGVAGIDYYRRHVGAFYVFFADCNSSRYDFVSRKGRCCFRTGRADKQT
ncbi:hypothetical protein ES703_82775 [subsurface metagenome]